MKCTTPLSSAPLDVGGKKSSRIITAAQAAIRLLQTLAPVLDLGIRVLIGLVFFQSGLTKLASWSTTLALFESEYTVPLLNPALAAYLGTAAELSLPVLLVLGLGTRAAALALFVFNIVAVISYPGLGEVGLKDHQYWGLLLLVTLLHGPGQLSLDHLIDRFLLRGKASH
ncbi:MULTISPECIES: DoxX family protein [Cupriavidus]|uniref:DoxX family protein n=1 Tax=Cupriavidus TaxID=106589 RepID=UPI001A9EC291|nr:MULTISPECIES: DoxX family protein [Cupriavidus]